MKNFLIAFLVFLIWSFFGIWLYSWLQPLPNATQKNLGLQDSIVISVPDVQKDTAVENEIKEDTTTSKAGINETEIISNNLEEGIKGINKEGDIIFYFPEGIPIQKNSPEITIPATSIDFKYKINTYLLEHPKQEVHIISYYDASENIEEPNLGFQRGGMIQKMLIEIGVPPHKIVIKPMIKDLSFSSEGTYQNGIYFNFNDLDESRPISEVDLLPESKTIYPEFVNNDIFVNNALKSLLEEAKQTLSKDPNVTLEITGHTDNVGNASDNYRLGLDYARQVRWYLISKGNFDKKRIKALSEGESKSIANNSTEKGRSLNRRIEINYKKN